VRRLDDGHERPDDTVVRALLDEQS
jgi:hypothetical protein